MNCYVINVETTNSMGDTFKLDGKYHPCERGVVYVIAKDAVEAANMIPNAISICRVGPAFSIG